MTFATSRSTPVALCAVCGSHSRFASLSRCRACLRDQTERELERRGTMMQEDEEEPEVSLRAQRRRWKSNREKTLREWLATATKEQHEAVIELFVEEELGRKRN